MSKTFYRWVPREYAEAALRERLLSHNGSAMWVFDLTKPYRPGRNITRNAYLIAYDVDDLARSYIEEKGHISFESDEFEGEGKHPRLIIVKNNEEGAYGLGRMRQGATNPHVKKTRLATKKEVAKALGLSVLEVSDDYRMGTTWPS